MWTYSVFKSVSNPESIGQCRKLLSQHHECHSKSSHLSEGLTQTSSKGSTHFGYIQPVSSSAFCLWKRKSVLEEEEGGCRCRGTDGSVEGRDASVLFLFSFRWTDYPGPSPPKFPLSVPLFICPLRWTRSHPKHPTPSPSQTSAWCRRFFFVFLLYMEHNKKGSNFL